MGYNQHNMGIFEKFKHTERPGRTDKFGDYIYAQARDARFNKLDRLIEQQRNARSPVRRILSRFKFFTKKIEVPKDRPGLSSKKPGYGQGGKFPKPIEKELDIGENISPPLDFSDYANEFASKEEIEHLEEFARELGAIEEEQGIVDDLAKQVKKLKEGVAETTKQINRLEEIVQEGKQNIEERKNRLMGERSYWEKEKVELETHLL